MAKALMCAACGAVKTFIPDGSTTFCDCKTGQVVGWWVDQNTGFARIGVLPPGTKEQARVVLMHNGYLRADMDTIPASYASAGGGAATYSANQHNNFWKHVHTEALAASPKLLALQAFSQRGCPVVVQIPGTTPDTHWAEDAELVARGLV